MKKEARVFVISRNGQSGLVLLIYNETIYDCIVIGLLSGTMFFQVQWGGGGMKNTVGKTTTTTTSRVHAVAHTEVRRPLNHLTPQSLDPSINWFRSAASRGYEGTTPS